MALPVRLFFAYICSLMFVFTLASSSLFFDGLWGALSACLRPTVGTRSMVTSHRFLDFSGDVQKRSCKKDFMSSTMTVFGNRYPLCSSLDATYRRTRNPVSQVPPGRLFSRLPSSLCHRSNVLVREGTGASNELHPTTQTRLFT